MTTETKEPVVFSYEQLGYTGRCQISFAYGARPEWIETSAADADATEQVIEGLCRSEVVAGHSANITVRRWHPEKKRQIEVAWYKYNPFTGELSRLDVFNNPFWTRKIVEPVIEGKAG